MNDKSVAFRFTQCMDTMELDDLSDEDVEMEQGWSQDGQYCSKAADSDDETEESFISPGEGAKGVSVEEYERTKLREKGGMFEASVSMTDGNHYRLGDYVVDLIDGERGSGAFGIVYEGKSIIDNASVAVKKIRAVSDQEIADVMTEIRNLDKIPRHINVVSLLEFHCKLPFYWIVMEYCDLGDLQQYIMRKDPNLLAQADLMLQSARGLHHMHSLRMPVVHRDIKPANIMLKADEEGKPMVKITDFGLAKMVNLESTMAKTVILETQAGTPGFMAPEFFAKMAYTKSVDVFALGLVFLSMINYKRGDKHLLPLIEKSREMCAVGDAMRKAHIHGRPQPVLISDNKHDSQLLLGVKKLIRDMCCYLHTDRLRMAEVVKRLEKLQPSMKTAPTPAPRTRHSTNPQAEKGVAFKMLDEAARDRNPSTQRENRQLISMFEEQFANLSTDYNPDEFHVNDSVKIDTNRERVQQLHESLFGIWTEKLNPYLGQTGRLTKKTSFYCSVVFEDGKEWKFHPALLTKVTTRNEVKPIPKRPASSSKRGFGKRYLRGDVVMLPDDFSVSKAKDKKVLEQRAMVSKYNGDENLVTLEFATGVSCNLEADLVKAADLSGNVIDDGDMVIVSADRDQLKKLQRGAGGFQPGMENLLGKAGIVENLYDNNTARVQFKSEKKAWTLNIQALKLLYKAEELMQMVAGY